MKEDMIKKMYLLYVSNKVKKDHTDIPVDQILKKRKDTKS